jgi:hypothetical protein
LRGLDITPSKLPQKALNPLWGKFERGQFPLSIKEEMSRFVRHDTAPCHPEERKGTYYANGLRFEKFLKILACTLLTLLKKFIISSKIKISKKGKLGKKF